jgi:superfamily II DNA or RNA helicase
VDIELPQIVYGPLRVGAGTIQCVLRGSQNVRVSLAGEIFISPRVKETLHALPNGEVIIITARRLKIRPPGVDGVLLRDNKGKLHWQTHTQIDQITEAADLTGWPTVVAERAREWTGRFEFRVERPNADGTTDPDKRGLRSPQIGALHAIGAHWSLYHKPATIIMPTGTGKTETMLSVLANFMRQPLLVVVPADALRSQTARKFLTFGLLRFLTVLHPDAPNPIVGMVTKVPKDAASLELFDRCNVIVSTMDALADSGAEPLWPEIVNRVGALIIDEAHHIGAKQWTNFREAFNTKPVLQFTATPFRRDGNVVDGAVIYSYPLRMAQLDGYFKPITFEPVYEPSPAEADKAIAAAAVARLRQDLKGGLNHLMMARCRTVDRAEKVHAIYDKLAPDMKPLLLHSDLGNASVLIEELKTGRSRIVVCVNMLGEGFDLPALKVAAIHDLHKSLAVLLQFAGRFTRVAGSDIGNATVIANIADANVSSALERLYSEDADWNELLSELSSTAARDHQRLVTFLQEAKRLDNAASDDSTIPISHKLIRPTLSTLIYEARDWRPKNFPAGLPANFVPHRVWLHEQSTTLFFVTRTEETVRWSRSKSVIDVTWNLFVLHYDEARTLIYLSSSDHNTSFDNLAKSVGGDKAIWGETIFRAMGRITRLIFQNIGVKKVGRRNLSYATYTGADIKEALSQAEKLGSRKALLSGMGWEGGRQITIGCSAKGRVWSRETGSVPHFNEWCEGVGEKLRDSSLDSAKLLDNVLLPTVVTTLPAAELLTIEWPVEILQQIEDRVEFRQQDSAVSQTVCELQLNGMDRSSNSIEFALVDASGRTWGTFRYTLGGPNDFSVTQISDVGIAYACGKINRPLEEFFTDYPPLFRFLDLSELDANLHIQPQNPYDLELHDDRIEIWDWDGVDIEKESMWKEGAIRTDSIQYHMAQHYLDAGFDVIFDDDSSGEAADLVCINEEDDYIRLVLVHCKFSGGPVSGGRVKDVVEVASQAVRSARWAGRFPQLCQHVKGREDKLKLAVRPTRFLKGSAGEINRFAKLSRFVPVKPEILIVQPGLTNASRTKDQSIVLASAMTYLKETVGLDLGIIGGEKIQAANAKSAA